MGRSIEVGWSVELTFFGGLCTKSTAARMVQFFGGGGFAGNPVVSFDTAGTFTVHGMLRGLNFYFVLS
jgi:hypothetical protein